jgi:hypothetical protein
MCFFIMGGIEKLSAGVADAAVACQGEDDHALPAVKRLFQALIAHKTEKKRKRLQPEILFQPTNGYAFLIQHGTTRYAKRRKLSWGGKRSVLGILMGFCIFPLGRWEKFPRSRRRNGAEAVVAQEGQGPERSGGRSVPLPG